MPYNPIYNALEDWPRCPSIYHWDGDKQCACDIEAGHIGPHFNFEYNKEWPIGSSALSEIA